MGKYIDKSFCSKSIWCILERAPMQFPSIIFATNTSIHFDKQKSYICKSSVMKKIEVLINHEKMEIFCR